MESSPLAVHPLGAYTPRSDGYYDSPRRGQGMGRRRRAQASGGLWQHEEEDESAHGDSLYQVRGGRQKAVQT